MSRKSVTLTCPEPLGPPRPVVGEQYSGIINKMNPEKKPRISSIIQYYLFFVLESKMFKLIFVWCENS
jgi:hypothetical protein